MNPPCHVCLLQWATLRIERGAKEKNHPLYKPYVNGKTLPCVGTQEFKSLLGRWGECGVPEQLGYAGKPFPCEWVGGSYGEVVS